MAITAYDEEMEIVAAGRPDIQKLIKAGVLKPEDIDPETGLRKQPTSEYRIRKKMVKDPDTGKKIQVALKEHFGLVEDPDCPGWRMGLSPEKYWTMLCAEVENRLRGRKDNYAPELTVQESQSFEVWLDAKLDEEPELLDVDEEEIPRHPVVRKVRRNQKKGKKVEKTEKKEEEKKEEPAKEENKEDDSSGKK